MNEQLSAFCIYTFSLPMQWLSRLTQHIEYVGNFKMGHNPILSNDKAKRSWFNALITQHKHIKAK